MKVRCEIEMDTETGSYGLKVHNLSSPGEPVDYVEIRRQVRKIFDDLDNKVPEPD